MLHPWPQRISRGARRRMHLGCGRTHSGKGSSLPSGMTGRLNRRAENGACDSPMPGSGVLKLRLKNGQVGR